MLFTKEAEDNVIKLKMERMKKDFNAFLIKKFAMKVDNPDKVEYACCMDCEQEYKVAVVNFTTTCPKCGESNSLCY